MLLREVLVEISSGVDEGQLTEETTPWLTRHNYKMYCQLNCQLLTFKPVYSSSKIGFKCHLVYKLASKFVITFFIILLMGCDFINPVSIQRSHSLQNGKW